MSTLSVSTPTRIIEIIKSEGTKAQVVLAEALFHPAGGGQPGDTGILEGENFLAWVNDARKKDNKLILDITVQKGSLSEGMEITPSIDLDRQHLLSRMHTAQHVFSRLQENAVEGLETTKVYIDTHESIIYVHYEGELDWNTLFELEDQTHTVILNNFPVQSILATREQAQSFPELKARWERIHDEMIRIVRIEGVDATACSGTHVSQTGDIGGFMVTGFNGSSPKWEIRFTTEALDRSKVYSQVMRRLLRSVGCEPHQLEEIFIRQKNDNSALQQVLDKVRNYLSIPWENQNVEGHPFYFCVPVGLTKDLLSAAARKQATETPDAFYLILLPDATDVPFPFILLRGSQVSIDLRDFSQKFPELEIRGGGKADWLNGTTTQRAISVWTDCIRRSL